MNVKKGRDNGKNKRKENPMLWAKQNGGMRRHAVMWAATSQTRHVAAAFVDIALTSRLCLGIRQRGRERREATSRRPRSISAHEITQHVVNQVFHRCRAELLSSTPPSSLSLSLSLFLPPPSTNSSTSSYTSPSRNVSELITVTYIARWFRSSFIFIFLSVNVYSICPAFLFLALHRTMIESLLVGLYEHSTDWFTWSLYDFRRIHRCSSLRMTGQKAISAFFTLTWCRSECRWCCNKRKWTMNYLKQIIQTKQ